MHLPWAETATYLCTQDDSTSAYTRVTQSAGEGTNLPHVYTWNPAMYTQMHPGVCKAVFHPQKQNLNTGTLLEKLKWEALSVCSFEHKYSSTNAAICANIHFAWSVMTKHADANLRPATGADLITVDKDAKQTYGSRTYEKHLIHLPSTMGQQH